jgi:hypothetical protein
LLKELFYSAFYEAANIGNVGETGCVTPVMRNDGKEQPQSNHFDEIRKFASTNY